MSLLRYKAEVAAKTALLPKKELACTARPEYYVWLHNPIYRDFAGLIGLPLAWDDDEYDEAPDAWFARLQGCLRRLFPLESGVIQIYDRWSRLVTHITPLPDFHRNEEGKTLIHVRYSCPALADQPGVSLSEAPLILSSAPDSFQIFITYSKVKTAVAWVADDTSIDDFVDACAQRLGRDSRDLFFTVNGKPVKTHQTMAGHMPTITKDAQMRITVL